MIDEVRPVDLSISYHLEFRGPKSELLRLMGWLRDRFAILPVRSVGEVLRVQRAVLPFEEEVCRAKTEEKQLGLGILFARLDRLTTSKPPRPCPPSLPERISELGNGLSLVVDVGEGCDPFVVLLGRMGKGRKWVGTRTTRTENVEHSIGSYLTVIRMLEICDQTKILRCVHDASGYWEAKDLSVLANNLSVPLERLRSVAANLSLESKFKPRKSAHAKLGSPIPALSAE